VTETTDFALELMQPLPDIRARRMFGGQGIFQRDLMFAIVVDDVLYFKADDQSRAGFTDRGLRPFTYTARGRITTLQYYEAPPEAWDEGEEMRRWARLALDAALRAAAGRKPVRRRKPAVKTGRRA
jgi:DNA transformation protein